MRAYQEFVRDSIKTLLNLPNVALIKGLVWLVSVLQGKLPTPDTLLNVSPGVPWQCLGCSKGSQTYDTCFKTHYNSFHFDLSLWEIELN